MKAKTILIFLALVYTIGWLFQGLAVMNGFDTGGKNWLVVAMWAPLLAALLAGPQSRRQLWRGLKGGSFGWWLIALGTGWSFSICQQLLLWVAHQGRWNSQFFELSADGKSIAAVHHLAMILGVGPQGFGKFALNWLLSVSLGSLVVMIIGGIGEEAGWRGILQRPIAERFGSLKGTLMVGLIWGYWHLPVNLAGYNDAHHAVWQALLIFPIHTIAMSFLLAWLVARSGSIWPAALAHGANNTLQSGPLIMPNHWFADQLTAVAASLMIGTAAAALLLQRKAVRKISTERLGKPDLVRQS
ncbi:MAG: CPBP family intramembrane metalloprotease [Acidobacteriaceae bacterium]|nr:CPBP family intramembrane metalloprotease [Acidobacteriaceae bacterium]